MQQLRSVAEGGIFRPATNMRDVNGQALTSQTALIVERKYDMSPYYVICRRLRPDLRPDPLSRGVCLGRETLVVGLYEKDATPEQIKARLELAGKPRRRAIGIRVFPENAALARRSSGVSANLYQFILFSRRRHLTMPEVKSIASRLEEARGSRISSNLISLLVLLEQKKLLEVVYVFTSMPESVVDLGLTEMYHESIRSAQSFIEAAKNEGAKDTDCQQAGDRAGDVPEDDEESCQE